MSSDWNIGFSCLADKFPSSIRELCQLEGDTILFCLEGDTAVYQANLCELRNAPLKKHPRKLFCEVPYLGIPVVVEGGKAGRVVVVIPAKSEGKDSEIDQWLVAVDFFSQALIPAPLKGRWSGAAVCNDRIHLLDSEGRRTCTVPKDMIFSCTSLIPSNCSACNIALKIGVSGLGGPPPPRGQNRPSTANSILLGTESRLLFCNDRGVFGPQPEYSTFVGAVRYLSNPTGLSLSAAAAAACTDATDAVLLGTATGEIWMHPKVSTHPSNQQCRLLLHSDDAPDKKISAMALLPDGSLLFSQDRKLYITDDIPDLGGRLCARGRSAACGGRDSERLRICSKPLPVARVMRNLVFEGGEGADIALVAEGGDGGVALSSSKVDDNNNGQQRQQKVYGMKWMLSCRCDFFRTAFSGPFKEANQSVMQIPDTSFEALRCVVLYLHTDMLELRDSFAVDVAAFARFLGLIWVQEEAERYAEHHVSPSNCASLLLSAERLQFPSLRESCVKCAARNLKVAVDAPRFADLSKQAMFDILKAQKSM
uniref:BTB domain-containing protein n=1 Tax=Chromera velia CCMP2878 TaxID=1169474 RepID=A0A0G4H6Q1_9ALVE|eukprot:Cvel_5772.t1-p1 / transcript=Cvel_5772.t1 / gene=Cvel_5772 / organism=Chromera_velia_CCMP2878 / gene_product=hypothetical protein / transcript_product=hypothetical protein / location=Cvel_scaffold274:65351-67625(+) / protein_length=536 / sequence_SO=supercontig / SO=protein_coding / is_pseudo=false